ncbi:MAG: WYL domain-containing protein [Halieaceae bacterium]|nr:WYL domain-containing protein [Halieaceae bacterium]
MEQTLPYRWDLLLRYRFIECIALWEGRLTTRHLVETFGIGRQQASKDINTYNRTVAPDNLRYDKFLKGYEPNAAFKPTVTRGLAEEYLQLLANRSELHRTFSSVALPQGNTEVLAPPIRPVSPELLRPLLQAAREQQRLEVDYASLNNPNREGRIIAPHTLVWTGTRWHVRGWCEKNQGFRDFVLSRFRGTPELLGPTTQCSDDDQDWHKTIEIILKPDPRLSEEQQDVVAKDFGMNQGQLCVIVRARLANYLLQLLNIHTGEALSDPKAQQVIIANRANITAWLF